MQTCFSAPITLVIRRDNIGDLACSKPLFRTLREHFHQVQIFGLVNNSNVAVLDHNPHHDQLFAKTKAKYRPPEKTILSGFFDRLRLITQMRRPLFGPVILAGLLPSA